jgi:hypothetical protein
MNRILKLAIFSVLLLLVVVVMVGSSLGAGSATPQLGAAHVGATSFEFIGKLDEPTLNSGTFYGYVTHIVGTPDASLFTDPATRTEATARLTFSSAVTLDAHLVQLPLFTTTGTGRTRFFFNPTAGASLADPTSFARGQLVATASFRFRDVLRALSDTLGVQSAYGDWTQLTSGTFKLGGKTYQFGHPRLRLRMTTAGIGTRTVTPLERRVVTSGDMVVTS